MDGFVDPIELIHTNIDGLLLHILSLDLYVSLCQTPFVIEQS